MNDPVLQSGRDARYTLRPDKRARSSAGEHLPDTEGVTGSIPVAPTIQIPANADYSTQRGQKAATPWGQQLGGGNGG